MSRITFSGYDPDPEDQHTVQRDAEDEILRHDLKLIMDNAERILGNPRHFFCQPATAYLSTAYVLGGPIPLGILLTLWKEGQLLDTCAACGGVVHVIGAGGALSMNMWWGYCAECGAPQRGSKKTFWADTCAPIHRMWHRHPNRTIIKRGTRAAYIRKGNRVERVQPDVVVRSRIEGTPLAALIEELKRPDSLPQVPEGVGTWPTPLATPAGSYAGVGFVVYQTKSGEAVLSPRSTSDPITLTADRDSRVEASHEAEPPRTPPPLVPTGLATLDRCLSGGLPSGTVTYLVSHWREDTRALMLTICGRHLLARPGAVAYAACERLESVMATLAKGRVRSGNPYPLARATSEDRAEYEAALRAIEAAPFCFIPIPPGHSMYWGDLVASVRLVQEAEPLSLLLINNLPALRPDEDHTREQGKAVAETLQRLAASVRVPVVAALSHSGEHGTDWSGPYTLTQEQALEHTRPGIDTCLLLGRLPLTTYRVRRVTMAINVASHPFGHAGGVVHCGFDRITSNVYETEPVGQTLNH